MNQWYCIGKALYERGPAGNLSLPARFIYANGNKIGKPKMQMRSDSSIYGSYLDGVVPIYLLKVLVKKERFSKPHRAAASFTV